MEQATINIPWQSPPMGTPAPNGPYHPGDQRGVSSPPTTSPGAGGIELRPFQKRFLKAGFDPDTRLSALSVPRGNGKSTLSGYVLARCMTPGDEWHQPGAEYILLAGSLKQARQVFRAVKDELCDTLDRYRWQDSYNAMGCVHKPSGTRLNAIASNGKTAMGLVGVPLVVADEPGAWEVTGGTLMYDALVTAQGKPDSDLRVLMIGTIAPATDGWWPDLINAGSRPGRHVYSLQGDIERWDDAREIARCNPLMWRYPKSRRVLLDERDEARDDSRLKSRFLSYRLNIPTPDETEVLLTVDDWERVTARAATPPVGQFAVGVDLGQNRAWSAAVATWENGRTEAFAVAPGIPSLVQQEKRDRVPAGTYTGLAEAGVLLVADGLRVPHPSQVWEIVRAKWGIPAQVLCDLFRLGELRDTIGTACPIIPRRPRYSDGSDDIRSLRKLAKDGPLNCHGPSARLIGASLAVAKVKPDESGGQKLIKRGTNNQARDDVAVALCQASGALRRRLDARPAGSGGIVGVA